MSQPRNTALSARSVVLSTLLGTKPPVLPVRVLVRSGELFGIAEGTIRTALSRMVAAGEVEPEDGSYRLAGRLLDRQARQEASRRAETKPWRGRQWRFVIVAAGGSRSAGDRAELRDTLRAHRLAELREGVWLRPDNLRTAPPPHPHCMQLEGRLEEEDDAALAARLWDLHGWASRARDLREELAASGEPHLAAGFVLSAAVLRHFQADPLLPPELLPDDWPGPALREDYAAWDRAYRALLRDWWKLPDSGG